MTIQFNCPNCEALIAFDSKHRGKRARCLTCGQILIIPDADYEKPQIIEPPIEKGDPEPGFYRAVFVDSCRIFFDRENITTLAFVIAVVCFKFFLAPAICCVNYISFVVIWGWLLGFYLNIIYETAFGIDKLPQIYLGTSTTFLWYVIKPFLVFFFTMIVVQFPFIIALALLKEKGVNYGNMWQGMTASHLLLQVLFIVGLFFFPMAILTTAVGRDITLLRPDYLVTAIFKEVIPYLIVVALLVAACILETHVRQYNHATFAVTAALFFVNLVVQIIAIIAMRSIGLFYRHYNCHLSW